MARAAARVLTWSRFLDYVEQDPTSDCILFTGHVRESGYATIEHEGRKHLVHRVAHELLIGAIPPGYQVDHLCFTRHCVNPFHLEAVTPMVNTMRSASPSRVNADKTHCDYGHEFTPENTYYRHDRTGRICRACGARRARAIRERRAA